MTQEYTIEVERDPESGWLVGQVVEVPEFYAQAATLDELENDLRQMIQAHAASSGDNRAFEVNLRVKATGVCCLPRSSAMLE